jgi:pyruvate/2-oxoglutarate dehydrogenase complex dihydrolipoamide acyltransferase (E2) component
VPAPPAPVTEAPAPAAAAPAAAAPTTAAPRVEAAPDARRRSRRVDWILGIVLGIVLGILVVVGFLLFGSEGTIDAPSIHGAPSGQPAKHSAPLGPAKEER